MRYNILITCFLLIIPLLACGGNPTPTTSPRAIATPTNTPISTPITELAPGVNLLVNLTGEATLKRAGWSDYHPTGFGMVLERGDLLKLSSGAEAQVLCDELTLWSVPSGAPAGLNNGCPQPPEPALIRFGGKIGGTRGGDESIPYIISPRNTTILDEKPLLQWYPHDPNATYTIRISGIKDWKKEGVTGNQLQYDGPILKAGQSYLLIVETDDRVISSQDEGGIERNFKLITETKRLELQSQVNEIRTLKLTSPAEALILAHLYAGHDVFSEAIDMLETAITNGQTDPIFYYTLAELYRESGLYLLALPHYETTLQLAQDNLELRAEAHAGLGEVYIALGDGAMAKEQLTKACEGYEVLGDVEILGKLNCP
ncbi:tetratricopeptide repeat protein [Anaerolineales bacterium HSG24]|nr:tetratricopeptide repeat protein [Anaerolineales bacterium HSG24]